MTEKPRYRAQFKGGALQAKPVLRPTLQDLGLSEAEQVTADMLYQRFLDSDPGNPDIDYEPTASINPSDPRTSHIRYWQDEQVMTIEWGDGGTPYAYHGVTPADARAMLPPNKSPGRVINRRLNQKIYGPI